MNSAISSISGLGLRRWLPAVLLVLLATAGAPAQATETAGVPRTTRRVVVDGSLEEWETGRGIALDTKEHCLPLTGPAYWGGPQDCSGTLYLAWDDEAIHLAGRITDDDLVLHPRRLFLGDAVEVFLRIEDDLGRGDYQWILSPLSPTLRWTLERNRGRLGVTDGGMDGVQVAGREIRDADGVYGGYTFEAAIPLANFPGFDPARVRTIGANIAVVDADGGPGQKTYLLWSGSKAPAEDPASLGVLRFEGERTERPVEAVSTDARWIVPAAILAALAVLLALAWVLRRPLRRVGDLPLPTRLGLVAALTAGLLIVRMVPGIMEDRRHAESVSRLEGVDDTLLAIVEDAVSARVVVAGREDPVSPVLALVEGQQLGPMPSYSHDLLPAVAAPRRRTLGHGTPILRTAIPLSSGEPVICRLPERVEADALSIVVSWRPPQDGTRAPRPGVPVGRVLALAADGSEEPLDLRLGREVDDWLGGADGTHAAGEAEIAWTNDAETHHADEVLWRFGAARRLVALEFQQVVPEGELVLHGATALSDGEASPLPLGRHSVDGIPTGSWDGEPLDAAVVLGPQPGRWERSLNAEADLVHMFYASMGHAPERAGAGVASVHLRLDDGTETDAVILRNGENLDGQRLPGRDHPPDFSGVLAIRWSADDGSTNHRDVLSLPVPAGRSVAALVVDYLGEQTRIVVDGVTLARRRVPPSPTGLKAVVRNGATFAASPSARERLAGLSLTHYRRGLAVASTLPPEVRDRLLGTERPAVEPGTLYERLLDGQPWAARQVPLPFRDGDEVLEVLVPIPGDNGDTAPWLTATALLSLLLLPLAVSAVVDLLGLLPHLRWKLVGAFGLAAVLPLATLTVVLVRSFEKRVEGDVASELHSHGASVDRALRARRERARTLAAAVAGEEPLLRTLSVADPADRSAALDALARERSAAEGPGVVVAIETVQREDGRQVRRTYPLRAVPAPLQGVYEPQDGLHYRWSRLVATGVATARTEEARVTVVVEIPVDEESLGRLRRTVSDRAHLRLFSPDGFPVASTLDVPRSATPEAVADRRTTADLLRRDPGEDLLRRESLGGIEHEVAWKLLRDGDRTVGLLATAVPRRPLQAATLGTRDLLLVLGAAALLLAVLVANLVTHRLSEPVTALARVARRVEAGDFDVRATATSADELGALADAFNGMTTQLRGRIDELSRLNAHLGDLVGTLERPRVLDLTVETFRDAAEPDGLLVVVADDGASDLEVAAGWRFGDTLEPSRLPASGRIARALSGDRASTDTLPPLTEGAGDVEADLLSGFRSCTALPFSAGGGRTRGGILLLHAVAATGDDAGRLDFLAALAHQAAIALENARLYRLAVEDPETGLYGPTYFRKRMQEEIDRGLEAGRPVSLIIATIDGVDAVVRTGGPEAGRDALFRAFSAMRSTLRSMHLAARWDREEMAVLLPETPRGVANEVAVTLRAAVASAGSIGDLPHLRLAVGVATAPEDAGSAAFLEDAAERGLREGRDQRGAADPAASFGAPDGVDSVEAEALGFRSEKSLLLLDALNRVATSDVPVLVLGETGAGKEVVADIVHGKSRRDQGPLVKVNCAALPGPLLESELFGYERGAFTGADRRHAGRFEQADGGTLFLDEIGEMPIALQVKLLRVLQDGRVQRLGGTEPVAVDVRIIAATNRDLPALIESGSFREDLYFRLNVLSVVVPPLRARREDIPLLAERFLRQASLAHGGGSRQFTPEALDLLHRHAFPGNVRELRNMVERAVVGAKGDRIVPGDLSFGQSARPTAAATRTLAPVAPARRPAERPARDIPDDLSPRGRRLLSLLRRRGTLTNTEWSKHAGVSSRTGLRDFDELMDRGLALREGKRRGARYRPVE